MNIKKDSEVMEFCVLGSRIIKDGRRRDDSKSLTAQANTSIFQDEKPTDLHY